MADHISVSFALDRSDDGNAVHLSSPQREHDTDGHDCWCGPTFYRVCMDCDDGCWKCDGGKHLLTSAEAAAESEPMLIVHRG